MTAVDPAEAREIESSPPRPTQSGLLSRLLLPALQWWVRSQLDDLEHLELQLHCGDRQLLGGYIPCVTLQSRRAVYQGLHLSHLQLTGNNIRINLGQVRKTQTVQLLEPVIVDLTATLLEPDLNASLLSPLLQQGLNQQLLQLLGDQFPQESAGPPQLTDFAVTIHPEQLTLTANLVSGAGAALPIVLRTGLSLATPQVLRLDQPQWLAGKTARRGLPLTDTGEFLIDLGPGVALQSLTLIAGQVECRGQLTILPAE